MNLIRSSNLPLAIWMFTRPEQRDALGRALDCNERVDLASGMKTQLTFGTHDDSAAQFLDDLI